jgi:lysozyme family protein
MKTIEAIIDAILEKEGGFVHHPHDRGGPTRYGITRSVARLAGWAGKVSDLPESFAREIYKNQYYEGPGFNRVNHICEEVAMELVDTGVNMGPPVAVQFLQRSLNALNREATLYPDLKADGFIGTKTLTALQAYLDYRRVEGVDVLLKALNCLQGERYIALAEKREENESFVYGWLKERVQLVS